MMDSIVLSYFWYWLHHKELILQINFVVKEVGLHIPFQIQTYPKKTIYKAYIPSTIYIDSIQFIPNSLKKIKSF